MLRLKSMAPGALAVSVCALFMISGCLGEGGGSQDRPEGGAESSFSGQVIDPPIAGALVKLVNADGEALSALVSSDQDGRFQLRYRGSAAGARLEAAGGRDSGTGLSFQGLSLAAPLERNPNGIVSPVSTLVAHLTAQGFSLDNALQRVADRLGLDADTLLESPEQHAALQQRSILIGQFHTLLRGERFPGDLLWQAVDQFGIDLAGAAAQLAVDDDLLAATRQRLTDNVDLLDRLAAVPTEDTPEDTLGRATVTLVQATLERYLAESLDYEAASESARANLAALADAVWRANRQRGLQPSSAAGLNVVRYLLNQYDVDGAALDADGFQVPAGLAGDAVVPVLAEQNVIDPTQPLAPGERFGDDEAARRAYFFRSSLSPFYRSEALFEGVFDDNYLDPLYAGIAEGQARAGLIDEATLTLRTQVFSPLARITAFRDVGVALLDLDQREAALDALDRSAEDWRTYLQRVGLRNITGKDATAVLNLINAYIDAGELDKADAVLEPLYEYVDLVGDPNGPFLSTYYNINTALLDLAEAQVLEAERQRFSEPYFSQALRITNLLADWTDNLGTQENTLTCAVIRTQYTARYAALYARLGELERARDGTDTFSELLQLSCNGFSTSYTNLIAPVYGYLEAFDEFETFLQNTVTPIPPLGAFSASQARQAIRAQRAVALVKDQSVDAAMGYLASELGNDLSTQITLMTFNGGGINESDEYTITNVSRNVLNTLRDQGFDDLAVEVSEAVWARVNQQDYLDRYQDGENAILLGCRKAALASEYLGRRQEAMERMDICADRAQQLASQASSTTQRYDLLSLTGQGLYYFDQPGRLPEIASALSSLANNLGDTEQVFTVQKLIARLWAASGASTNAQNVLEQSISLIRGHAETATSETQRSEAFSWTREAIQNGIRIANKLRGRTVKTGSPDSVSLSLASAIEEQVRTFSVEDSGGLSGFEIGRRINSLSSRNQSMNFLADLLGQLDALDAARIVADAGAGSARFDRLARAVSGLGERDLFPGTTAARYDHDGDGQPDFFNPSATDADVRDNLLTLDSDIDGDGQPDSTDPTPYCGAC